MRVRFLWKLTDRDRSTHKCGSVPRHLYIEGDAALFARPHLHWLGTDPQLSLDMSLTASCKRKQTPSSIRSPSSSSKRCGKQQRKVVPRQTAQDYKNFASFKKTNTADARLPEGTKQYLKCSAALALLQEGTTFQGPRYSPTSTSEQVTLAPQSAMERFPALLRCQGFKPQLEYLRPTLALPKEGTAVFLNLHINVSLQKSPIP